MNTFRETQRFTQWWLWIPLLITTITVTVIPFSLSIKETGHIFNNGIEPFIGIIIMLCVVVPLFIIMRMKTVIDTKSISVKYIPFINKWKHYDWNTITKAEVRKYKPLLEYGGWGLRFGLKGTAYNVSGNMGLQLEFADGKKLLIGTQNEKELQSYLTYLKAKYNYSCIVV